MIKKISFLFIPLLLLFACSKHKASTEIEYLQWNVTKVEGAVVGSVNQVIPLTVHWPFSSGCDVLDKFEEVKQGNIISVKAFGHFNGQICTQDAGIKTKIYNFQSRVTGTYELRFINKDGNYIMHTITVN